MKILYPLEAAKLAKEAFLKAMDVSKQHRLDTKLFSSEFRAAGDKQTSLGRINKRFGHKESSAALLFGNISSRFTLLAFEVSEQIQNLAITALKTAASTISLGHASSPNTSMNSHVAPIAFNDVAHTHKIRPEFVSDTVAQAFQANIAEVTDVTNGKFVGPLTADMHALTQEFSGPKGTSFNRGSFAKAALESRGIGYDSTRNAPVIMQDALNEARTHCIFNGLGRTPILVAVPKAEVTSMTPARSLTHQPALVNA